MHDLLEAYDWIRLAETTREQLDQAHAKLAENGDHPREQGWLADASALLSDGAEARRDLSSRARRLPELAAVRKEHAADLIAPWSDAIEHLHAGIVYHAGLRSPLIEALFPHKKFDALRRGSLDAARAYGADLSRRLASSYVERLLAREEFAFAKPSVDEVTARWAPLAEDGEAALSDEERAALAEALTSEAQALHRRLEQARLLTEAALAPLPGAFQELGLRNRPKPRAKAKPLSQEEAEAPAAEATEKEKPKPKTKVKKAEAKPKAEVKKPKAEAKPAAKKSGKGSKKRAGEASASPAGAA